MEDELNILSDDVLSDDDNERIALAVDMIRGDGVDNSYKILILRSLAVEFRPHSLRPAKRRDLLIRQVIDRGAIESVVHLLEVGDEELARVACNFLVDISFGSDVAALELLELFGRIASRLERIFEPPQWERDQDELLQSAVTLCMNIAATRHESHSLIMPLVQPVCLRIIKIDTCMDELRGNAITLLANLSMTVASELRALSVAEVLLEFLTKENASDVAKSVAESVIIYLHGGQQCREVDMLMAMNVVGDYIVPLMECTLQTQEFRGMHPYLIYTARLFRLLVQTRVYAEALVAHEQVVPLLMEVFDDDKATGWLVESDLEGRCLILRTLAALVRLQLCLESFRAFEQCRLPGLLEHSHAGVRSAAAELWARLHEGHIRSCLMAGSRLDGALGLHPGFWRDEVLSFLYPCLVQGAGGRPPA